MKLFLLFIFCGFVSCGSLLPVNETHNMKKMLLQKVLDKSLVDDLSEADPAKVKEIIVLLEKLVSETETVRQTLQAAVASADEAFGIADTNLVNAIKTLSDANKAVVAADQAVVDATSDKGDAEIAHASAVASKNTADDNWADQSGALDDEEELIKKVIEMLETLLPEKKSIYVEGIRKASGSDECPSGYSKVIDQKECEEIAAGDCLSDQSHECDIWSNYVGKSNYFAADHGSANPYGCYYDTDNGILFNTNNAFSGNHNEVDDRPICNLD